MNVSPDEQSVVATRLHLGSYGVMIYDLRTGRTSKVRCPLGDGQEVLFICPGHPTALRVGGLGTHFFVEGKPDGRLNLIAYSWEAPESPVGAVALLGDGSFRVDGDPSIWLHPPFMYPDYFPKVIRIKEYGPELIDIQCEPPSWLVNSESGANITPLPDGRRVVLSSARGLAQFIVWDLDTQELVAEVDGDGGYPPDFFFRSRGEDMWMTTMDTIKRFRTSDWSLTSQRRVPESGRIKAVFFDRAEARAAVVCDIFGASGSRVYVVDVGAFEVTHRIDFDESVERVHVLADGRVVATSDYMEEVHVVEPDRIPDAFISAREPGDRIWL